MSTSCHPPSGPLCFWPVIANRVPRSQDVTVNPANSAPPRPPSRLNGWKEIAAYFGKGVRTVQRWEKELGLPVHRIGSAGGEIVYAIASELESWQASASAEKAMASARTANGDNHDQAAIEDPVPVTQPPSTSETQISPRKTRLRWVTLVVFLGVVGIVAGTPILNWYVHRATLGQPASFRIVDRALAIYDADGRFLWNYRFEFPLTESFYITSKAREQRLEPVVFDDIDGDGNTEVLFVSEPWLPTSRGLFCFDRLGKLRFNRVPDQSIKYGEKTYGPPWRGCFVSATGATGRPHDIWFVSTHLEEFPTVLEKLDVAGHVQAEYWSDGQISKVVVTEQAGRQFVFVGAISNELKGGTLAVLDARAPSGSSPAASDHYRCSGCPSATPLAFVAFPRLDVTAAVGWYSNVACIVVDALGQIMVVVRHPAGDRVAPELQWSATSLYTLNPQFHVKSAELGEAVAIVHRAIEKDGLLDHPFSIERDSLQLWPVRRWNGKAFDQVNGPETGR